MLEPSFLETAPADDGHAGEPVEVGGQTVAILTAHLASFVLPKPGHVIIREQLALRNEWSRYGDYLREGETEHWVQTHGGWAAPQPPDEEPPLADDPEMEWAHAFLLRLRAGDDRAQQELSDLTRHLTREGFYKLCRALHIRERRLRHKRANVSRRQLQRRGRQMRPRERTQGVVG